MSTKTLTSEVKQDMWWYGFWFTIALFSGANALQMAMPVKINFLLYYGGGLLYAWCVTPLLRDRTQNFSVFDGKGTLMIALGFLPYIAVYLLEEVFFPNHRLLVFFLDWVGFTMVHTLQLWLLVFIVKVYRVILQKTWSGLLWCYGKIARTD